MYNFIAYLKNGANLVGFRFENEDGQFVDVTVDNMRILSKGWSKVSDDIEEWKGIFADANASMLNLGNNTQIVFTTADAEEDVDINLDSPDKAYLEMGYFTFRFPVPAAEETQNAIIAVNNLLYRDTDDIQLKGFHSFDVDKDGNVLVDFFTYYSDIYCDKFCGHIMERMAEEGIDGEISTEMSKKGLIYKLKVFPTKTVAKPMAYQMALTKSKYMSTKTLVYDVDGVAYNVPQTLDLYSKSDISVTVVNKVNAVERGTNTFMRLYVDAGRPVMLMGKADNNTLMMDVNQNIIAKYDDMMENIELLSEVLDGEAGLPRVINQGDEYLIFNEVPVDMSYFPIPEDELLEQMEEEWTSGVYSTDMNLSKMAVGLAPSLEKEGNLLLLKIVVTPM